MLRHRTFIVRLATRLSDGDADLRDDFVQEGLIGAWEVEPAPHLSTDDMMRLERRAIAHRMWWFRRREQRALNGLAVHSVAAHA